jgi:hypothetical protein
MTELVDSGKMKEIIKDLKVLEDLEQGELVKEEKNSEQ